MTVSVERHLHLLCILPHLSEMVVYFWLTIINYIETYLVSSIPAFLILMVSVMTVIYCQIKIPVRANLFKHVKQRFSFHPELSINALFVQIGPRTAMLSQ